MNAQAGASRLRGSTEPRVFTPPLRELTPETSLGFACIDFAREILRVQLDPWQEWLLIHALELLEDGGLRYRTIVVLVARQNGKTFVETIIGLFFMFVLQVRTVLGAAQDLDTAEEVWENALGMLEGDPELAPLVSKAGGGAILRSNGRKEFVLPWGSRWKPKAASRKSGRGFTGDLVFLDELREHQSWAAWSALSKTTMARPNAQVWCFSNAGDALSVVLRWLRLRAHDLVGDPDGVVAAEDPAALLEAAQDDPNVEDAEQIGEALADDALGFFEWSAPPDAAREDRSAWAAANPSLGYGRLTERAIAAAAANEPRETFMPEVFCQWIDGAAKTIWPPGSWEATTVPFSRVAPGERTVLTLDVAFDASRAHVGIVGMNDEGVLHGGVIASRAGTDWVVPYLSGQTEALPTFDGVVIQGRGAPASRLIEPLELAGVPVIRCEGADLTAAHGEMFELLQAHTPDAPTFAHIPQPVLDVPAAAAVSKPLGDAWVIDRRKSPVDVAPMSGLVMGVWAIRRAVPPPSAYESYDLLVM